MTHMKKNPNPPQHLSNFYNINNLKKYIQTKNLKNKKKLSIKIKEEVFLQERNLQNITSWDIVTILSELEKYNGTGYIKNHPSVLTPYLWSKTNHYTRGKYSSDGHFDPNLVDKQIGCMPLIRYITDKTLQ